MQGMDDWTEADLRSGTIEFKTYGANGPATLIEIGGWFSTRAELEPMAELVADAGIRVVAVRLLTVGHEPSARKALGDLVHQTLERLTTAKVLGFYEPIALFGHSRGAVAVRYAESAAHDRRVVVEFHCAAAFRVRLPFRTVARHPELTGWVVGLVGSRGRRRIAAALHWFICGCEDPEHVVQFAENWSNRVDAHQALRELDFLTEGGVPDIPDAVDTIRSQRDPMVPPPSRPRQRDHVVEAEDRRGTHYPLKRSPGRVAGMVVGVIRWELTARGLIDPAASRGQEEK